MASYKDQIDAVLAELKAIDAKIDQRSLSEEERAFVGQLIEEARYRKEFWRKMLERVAAGTAWTLLVSMAIGLFFMARQFFKSVI